MRRQDKQDPDSTDTRTVQTHEKIQAHGGENDTNRNAVRQSEARTWKQTKEKDGKKSGTGANKRGGSEKSADNRRAWPSGQWTWRSGSKD